MFHRTVLQDIKELPARHFKDTNNSDALIRNSATNALYFELSFPSQSAFAKNRIQIKWDIGAVSKGWYNINAMADLEKAIFEVRVNDRILERIRYDKDDDTTVRENASGTSLESPDYPFFRPYINTGMDVFHHTHYLGTIGKEYGNTLNQLLKNDTLHDPYACRNTEIENASLLLKNPSLHEYQAIRMAARPINQVTLTLPCGRRSAIDEIERFLKYSGGGSMAGAVQINIAGHGIPDGPERQAMASRIKKDIENSIDGTVEVKEVNLL